MSYCACVSALCEGITLDPQASSPRSRACASALYEGISRYGYAIVAW